MIGPGGLTNVIENYEDVYDYVNSFEVTEDESVKIVVEGYEPAKLVEAIVRFEATRGPCGCTPSEITSTVEELR